MKMFVFFKKIGLQTLGISLIFLTFSGLCWFQLTEGVINKIAQENFICEDIGESFWRRGLKSIQEIDENVDALDAFWKDRIFKKNILSKIDIILTYFCTGESASSQVVVGKDDWLFYKSTTDGDSMADYEGTNAFSQSDMDKIKNSALKVQNELEEQGISFTVLVCPNKQSIYYEFMPDEYVYSNVSRTDQLSQYLNNYGVNIINPKEELLALRHDYQLYYSYDTHWNQLGAYVGVEKILSEWGIKIPALADKSVLAKNLAGNYHYCAEDDLAKMLGLRSVIFNDETEYEVNGTRTVDWGIFEAEQNNQGISHFNNPNAMNKGTLLLIGDSFRTSMVPVLCEQFENIFVGQRNCFQKDMLDEIRPNYVIVEYVERYSAAMEEIDKLFFD